MPHLPVYKSHFALPAYKVGKFGPWEIGHSADIPELRDDEHPQYVVQRGYSTGHGLEDHYHFLRRNDPETGQSVLWMNTSRREQESHVVHVKHAKGVVIVVGGGMGMVLKAISDKPDVERVVLVERDPEILDLLLNQTDIERWVGRDKLSFVMADAFDPTLAQRIAKVSGVQPGEADYLYVDIWEKLGSDHDWSDTIAIQTQLKAKRVGFWGQELHLLAWCMERGMKPSTLSVQTWDQYQLNMGMAMSERSEDYMRFCLRAGIVMYEAYQEKNGWA